LTLNKYMAMGPSWARCQEWPYWLVAGSKLLLCSALRNSERADFEMWICEDVKNGILACKDHKCVNAQKWNKWFSYERVRLQIKQSTNVNGVSSTHTRHNIIRLLVPVCKKLCIEFHSLYRYDWKIPWLQLICRPQFGGDGDTMHRISPEDLSAAVRTVDR
jgi:hypothetical protein